MAIPTMHQEQPTVTESPPEHPSLRGYLDQALPGCRAETIARLVDTARIRFVQPGQQIYRQGEPVPLTILLDGYGAARRTTVDGKELVSGVARTGVCSAGPAWPPSRQPSSSWR